MLRPFPRESAGRPRKDEISGDVDEYCPVGLSALNSLHCFDTVGLATGRNLACKNLLKLSTKLKISFRRLSPARSISREVSSLNEN